MIALLVKMNLRALFSSMFRGSKNTKKRKKIVPVLLALLAVYVIAIFLFMFGTLFFSISEAFHDIGVSWLYFSMAGILIFGFCFIGTVFMTQSQIFDAKDNDFLLSLPLKPSTIMLSRVTSLIVFDYLYELLIALPAIAIWCYRGYATVPVIVAFILAIILLPLLSMSLTLLVGWAISLITLRMRNKNIITLVLSLAFMGLYFYGYANINKYMTSLVTQGAEIAAAFRAGFPPLYWFGTAIADGSIPGLLLFALCCLAPFAIVTAILSASFISIVTTKRGAKKIKYRERQLKAAGAKTALLKRELRHFLSNPMLILNMALASVFVLLAGIILLIKPELITPTLLQLSDILPDFSPAIVCTAILTAVACLNTAAAALVSLEGKSLWIVQSLPVRPTDILMAKINLHLVICGAPVLLAALCCAIAFGGGAADILLLLCLPSLFSVFMGFAGVTLNLLLPKFDWLSEVQPAKQGLAVMLTMFGAMALVILLVIVYIFVFSGFGPQIFLAIAALIAALGSALLYLYLRGPGARRFARLEG